MFSTNKEVSFGNIRKAIIFCFFVASLLALVLDGCINFFLTEHENRAEIVNLVGKQRMLSQEITKSVHVLQTDNTVYQQIIRDTKRWDSIHKAIRIDSKWLGILPYRNARIDSLLDKNSLYRQNYLQLIESKDLGNFDKTQLSRLLELEGQYLKSTGQLVNELQAKARKETAYLKYIIAFLVFLFVLFIFGLYKIFVKPIIEMVRSLSDEKERQVSQSISILENTSDLIWSIDSDYRLLAHNSAFSKSVFKESGILPNLGENILRLEFSNNSFTGIKKLYDRALSGESFESEFEVSQKEKSIFFALSFYPIYDKDDNVSGCSVFRSDVTQRVEIYQELQESEQNLREAQEIANCGHWNWDMTSNKIKWSKQLYKVFEKDPATFRPTYEGFSNIIHPEDREAVYDDIENCIENHRLHDLVSRIVLPDGSIRYTHQKGRVYYDKDNRPVRMVGTTQDVTAMEHAKQHIAKQYNELQNFVYVISHNLRSPIANLQALVDIIEPGNEELNAEVLSNIGTMVQALDRTVIDLNHTLSLKNVSADTFEEVELEAVLKDVKQLLVLDIARSGAEITYDFSRAPKAFGIKSYFTNILLNLIMNAISFRAAERAPCIQIVSGDTALGGMEIRVMDNGKGMALNKERLKKIFDMYGRLSGSTDGRGLGLYLVKTQVEAMEGSIMVESEPDQGSVFTILFTDPKANPVHMNIV